jgi:hypothetical protein
MRPRAGIVWRLAGYEDAAAVGRSLAIALAVALLLGLPRVSHSAPASPPPVPTSFKTELDSLKAKDGLTLADAIAIDVPASDQRLAVHLISNKEEAGLRHRFMILRAGPPSRAEFSWPDPSTGVELGGADSRSLCGKDVNGDGYPEVITMIDPGGSSAGTSDFVILTLTPEGVRQRYKGNIFRMVDLNHDGVPEIVTMEEDSEKWTAGMGHADVPVIFHALRWSSSGAAYLPAPDLERRRAFKEATVIRTSPHQTSPSATSASEATPIDLARSGLAKGAATIHWTKNKSGITTGPYYGCMVAFITETVSQGEADAFASLVVVPDWGPFCKTWPARPSYFPIAVLSRKSDGFHESFPIPAMLFASDISYAKKLQTGAQRMANVVSDAWTIRVLDFGGAGGELTTIRALPTSAVPSAPAAP